MHNQDHFIKGEFYQNFKRMQAAAQSGDFKKAVRAQAEFVADLQKTAKNDIAYQNFLDKVRGTNKLTSSEKNELIQIARKYETNAPPKPNLGKKILEGAVRGFTGVDLSQPDQPTTDLRGLADASMIQQPQQQNKPLQASIDFKNPVFIISIIGVLLILVIAIFKK